jgi:phosphoribosylanthranilate isomerase
MRFKICCMASGDEVRMAVEHGADAVGFVSRMPSGAGIISEELIATLTPLVPPPVATFLLTCETSAGSIIAQQRRCNANTLQLCDRVSSAVRATLRRELPGVRIAQVVHVAGPESIEEALEAQETADAILLDSGNQALAVKELGGTGRTHDWSISASLREQVRIPVFLAGGLTPANVRDAIAAVRPFAVDVCSGVRTDGKLDPVKLAAFAAAVKE